VVINRLRPMGHRWYVLQAEFTLLALRSEQARTILRKHREQFEDQIVEVRDRLGQVPELPIKQLTDRHDAVPARADAGVAGHRHPRHGRAHRHRAAAGDHGLSREKTPQGG
jgi:hypothetical protein